MNKRIIGIGAIILVLGVALGFTVPNFVAPPFSYDNFTIQAGQHSSFNFTVQDSASVFFIEANFSAPVNAYLFTSSGFSAWESSISSGTEGLAAAESLEGRGTLEIVTNTSLFVTPGSGNGKLIYSGNSTNAANHSAAYVLAFENGNSKSVGVYMAYIPPTSLKELTSGGKVASYLYEIGMMEFVFFIAMPIAGIAVMIYGAFKKPKSYVPEANSAEVDRLYKGVEGPRKQKRASYRKR